MLIISESALRQLMSLLVTVSRTARDHNGEVPQVKTIDENTLRSAALLGLTVVSGQPCDTHLPQYR